MLKHGDIFRNKENDSLYMIDREIERNHYRSIRVIDTKSMIHPEEFFIKDCEFCGNLLKEEKED